MKVLAAAIAIALLHNTPALSETLRIASWNIANLAAQPEQALRGHSRSAEVYAHINTVIESLDADIIALQEIGSIPGAERALGSDYDIYFETRCMENDQHCRFDNDDIYTAIAVRKSIKSQVAIEQLDELSILHDDECCTPPRRVRGSPVAIVEFNEQKIWIPSIHLKSSCKEGASSNPDLKDDCEVNGAQLDILERWIADRPQGDAVILAGDFNRLLFEAPDVVARLGANAQLLPAMDKRACWKQYRFDFASLKQQALANNPSAYEGGLEPQIYTPTQFGAIDFFVVSGLRDSVVSDHDQIEMDAFYSFGSPGSVLTKCDGSPNAFGPKLLTFGRADPSDHCPILMVVKSDG